MNRGLIDKTLREVWPVFLVFGAAFFAVEVVLAYVLPNFRGDLGMSLLRLAMVRQLLEALLGADLGSSLGPGIIETIPWVHPVVLTIVGAQEITFASRVPAGEIDRGTADVLLALPISRLELYVSDSFVWAVSGLLLLMLGLTGYLVGTFLSSDARLPDTGRLVIVLANFYALYLCVGGVSYLASSLSDRRGRAVGVAFGVMLASFLLNFLARFWEPAQAVSFLSFLEYYRPLDILETGDWPLDDLAVLLVTGAVTWSAGGWTIRRRDISTV